MKKRAVTLKLLFPNGGAAVTFLRYQGIKKRCER